MTDQEYIEAFRQNDQKIIAAYYEQHRDQFCAWLGNKFHTLDIDLLSDVYIESVTRLWRFIRVGKIAEQHLQKPLMDYLCGIGKKTMLEEWRKYHKGTSDQQRKYKIEVEENLHIDTAYEEMLKRIKAAVNQMGNPCEPLLRKVHWDKLSMETVAYELRYASADSAKTQKYKCMQKLKRLLHKQP